MRKTWLIVGASLAGLLLLAGLGTWFLMTSRTGQELVFNQARPALEEALQAKVEIGQAEGSFWGGITWRQVKVDRADLRLVVEELSFKLDYLALRDRHVRITALTAVNPSLTWLQPLVTPTPAAPVRESDLKDGDVPASAVSPAPPTAPPSPVAPPSPPPASAAPPAPAPAEEWRVSLEEVLLKGGRVEGLGPALGRPELGPVSALTAKLGLAFGPVLQAGGQVTATVSLENQPVKLDLTADLKGDQAQVKALKLALGPGGRSVGSLAGPVDLATLAGQLDYALKLHPPDLPLGLLALPELAKLEGRVDLQGRVQGDLRALSLTAKGEWDKAKLDLTARLGLVDLDLTAQGQIRDLDPARLSPLAGTDLPAGLTGLDFNLTGRLPDQLAGQLTLAPTDLPRLAKAAGGEVEFKLSGRDLEGVARLREAEGFKAAATALEVRAKLAEGRVKAQVNLSGVKGYQSKIDQGRFTVAVDGNEITLTELDLDQGPGKLSGQARVLVDRGRLVSGRADLNLAGLSLPAALIGDLAGYYLGPIDLSSIKLSGPIKADWSGAEALAACPAFRLESAWGKIEGPVSVKLGPTGQVSEYALDLDLTKFKVPDWLTPLLPPELKRAVINGRLKITGKDGQSRFEADLGGSSLAGQNLDALKVVGRLREAKPLSLELERLEVKALGASLSAAGQVLPQARLDLRLKGRDLERALGVLGPEGLGLAALPPVRAEAYDLTASLTGPLTAPELKASLGLTNAAWEKVRLKRLDLKLDLGRLDLARLGLPAGQAEAKVTGLSLGERDELAVEVKLDGQGSKYEGRLLLSGPDGSLRTRLGLDLSQPGEPSLSLPGLELAVRRAGQSQTWRAQRPLVVELGPTGPRRIDLALSGSNQQALELNLTTKSGQLHGRGRVEALDLPVWAAVLGREEVKGGRLTVSLEADGPLASPRLSLIGRIQDLVILDQRLDLLSLSAEIKNGRLTGFLGLEAEKKRLAQIRGSMPLALDVATWTVKADPAELQATLAVDALPAAYFGPALKEIDRLAGTISAQVELTPQPQGWAKVEGLGFRLTSTNQRVQDGRIDLRLAEEKVTLERFSLASGGGTLTAAGSLGLGSRGPLDIQAELSPTVVNFGPAGRGRLRARFQFDQTLAAPQVKGRVEVEEIRFRLPRSEPEGAKDVVIVDQAAKESPPPPPPDRLKLDVEVVLANKTLLEGAGLKSRLGGGLKATKEPAEPLQVSGKIRAENGYFVQFGRRFTLEKGEVVFQGQETLDPALDILAQTRISDVEINLGVTGTASKPFLALSSRPALGQDDIMSYLLFGVASANLNERQSGELVSRAVGGALSSPTTQMVRGIVGEKLAPDVVTMGTSTRGGVSVETGKQILPNLYVSYIAYSEPAKPNELRVEYRFTSHISVDSLVGDPKTSGVDLKFRWDF